MFKENLYHSHSLKRGDSPAGTPFTDLEIRKVERQCHEIPLPPKNLVYPNRLLIKMLNIFAKIFVPKVKKIQLFGVINRLYSQTFNLRKLL